MEHRYEGEYPTPEEVMKHRIMDACIRCIGERGLERTFVQDIAREAGIARQTVYKYFENKTEILAAAYQREGLSFGLEVRNHIKNLGEEEAFVEAFVYVVKRFCRNPILAQLVSRGSTFLNDVGMKYFAFSQFGEIVFADIFRANQPLARHADEISELWLRNAISIISMPSHKKKTEKELRAYIRRRLIPGLHLKG